MGVTSREARGSERQAGSVGEARGIKEKQGPAGLVEPRKVWWDWGRSRVCGGVGGIRGQAWSMGELGGLGEASGVCRGRLVGSGKF